MARPGPVRPARPARWLARGLADAGHLERGQPGPGRMAGDARQAAIDHGGDAIDGDGTFGDVGGEDDLAFGRRAHGAVLLFGRLVAVEGEISQPCGCASGAQAGLRAADFGGPGRKTRTWPCRPRAASRSSAAATCSSSGAAECGVYSISSGYWRPSDEARARRRGTRRSARHPAWRT